jgi:hypothetical protein
MLKISTTAYYEWLKCPKTLKDKIDDFLAELIKTIFHNQRKGCGTRVIKKALLRSLCQKSLFKGDAFTLYEGFNYSQEMFII